MESKNILIYGGNGYTGKLFAQYLIDQSIVPILAGRSDKVKAVGNHLNCPVRVFETASAVDQLSDIDALVNLAGPFTKTQNGLIEACLKTKTHYLDIAGEVPEMENVFKYYQEAKDAGIVIMSAAGFGVVPTDIAANLACGLINDPIQLVIAYATEGGVSRGTLKTVLKDIRKPGVVLKNNIYEKAMPAETEETFSIFDEQIKMVYNPWRADLYTARVSTRIENIKTYSAFPGFVVSMMKGRLKWLRNLMLRYLINWLPEGPNKKQLDKGDTLIKAIAKNVDGEQGVVEIKGPEAYVFTIQSLERMLQLIFDQQKSGVLTPAQMGTHWMQEMKGVQLKMTSSMG